MMLRKIASLFSWFDTTSGPTIDREDPRNNRVDWLRVSPFIFLHLACFFVLWVGWSPIAIAVCAVLYFVRMFAITGFYHRYFSHRTYKVSRPVQFIMAVIGNASVQRGPLWWAAHHRHHHKTSDMHEDVHSPRQHGFWWSHMGWFMAKRNFPTDYSSIKDLMAYPELRFLDRFDSFVPFLLLGACGLLGYLLGDAWGTSGPQMIVWGFVISTVVLFHGTCTINSLSHVFGSKRYDTGDDSRNNLLLAFVTLGEGWHNNHHHYQSTVRQGFRWYEIDISFYLIWMMSLVGLTRDLKPVPAAVVEAGLRRPAPTAPGLESR